MQRWSTLAKLSFDHLHPELGTICCRFENGSPHLRRLGEFLQLQQQRDFQPRFVIQEQMRDELVSTVSCMSCSVE